MNKHLLQLLFLLVLVIVLVSCSKETLNEPEENQSEFYITTVGESVDQDSLLSYMEILSGEKSFNIAGITKRILGRHSNYSGNEIAADYIESKLRSYGLHVENNIYRTGGRNVIGKLTGTTKPNEYYVICAHYDSMPKDSIAPGADDNASGTSAVIEAARLLSKLNPNYSIIFALWDEEEQGLFGSRYWAAQAAASSMNIKGVFNLDMISWNSDDVESITVAIAQDGANADLTRCLAEINSKLNLGITINILAGKGSSDHVSFWEKGYNAIMIIEDLTDFNKLYHKNTDRIDTINIQFFKKISRLAISSLAKMAFM